MTVVCDFKDCRGSGPDTEDTDMLVLELGVGADPDCELRRLDAVSETESSSRLVAKKPGS